MVNSFIKETWFEFYFKLGDGSKLRDHAVELGVIQPLIEFIQKDIPVTFLRNITWVIVNLCRHKDPPLALNAVQTLLPALKYLLSYTDITVELKKRTFPFERFEFDLDSCR